MKTLSSEIFVRKQCHYGHEVGAPQTLWHWGLLKRSNLPDVHGHWVISPLPLPVLTVTKCRQALAALFSNLQIPLPVGDMGWQTLASAG